MPPDFTAHLADRCLVRVTGEDAFSFLQNIITSDMRGVSATTMIYGCLLTPQGKYLHDFFVFPDDGQGYFLDCETARVDDLLRRFSFFKLRSRVSLVNIEGEYQVYASTTAQPGGIADPRHAGLGYRIYAKEKMAGAQPVAVYNDFCVSIGAPCGSLTLQAEKDFMADVSLDLLNAAAWDKGCFVGQEVAARMHNKGVAKRRLYIASGQGLSLGALRLNNSEAGEIRQINSSGSEALAVVKVAAATGVLMDAKGSSVTFRAAPL